MIAKLCGERATSFAVPRDWRPGTAKVISNDELAANYEFVSVDHRDGGAVETFRHRQTGELIFRGRPDVARVEKRYKQLLENYGQIERMRPSDQKSAAAAFLKQATLLVDDTNAEEAGPLLLQGMGARLLGRWDVAEPAFGRVTVLQPTFVSGWNDLTWALASLGRFEEAETAARRAVDLSPDDPASLGNLASVLRERGKLDEALTTIKRALQLQPRNRINETILDQIRKDQGVPWYKRLFVN
jgi:tetratricopeptide (TPR) repeat protein